MQRSGALTKNKTL